MDRLRSLVLGVPDFPRPGILFRDIMPIMRDPAALRMVTDEFATRYRDERVDMVAGIESRGFLFGTPLAMALDAGFVAIRKLGKLPGQTVRREYALEYGVNSLELQRDAFRPGARVVIVDDVLATGGTARAARHLIEEIGGLIVGAAFLIELAELGGRDEIRGLDIVSLLTY